MGKVTSKLLVIDTSVAHAAGDVRAVHPTATKCRDLLIAVKDICHRITLPDELSDEWKRHQSRFARRWLVQMIGRKKVRRDAAAPLDGMKRQTLAAPVSNEQRIAMEKDWLLIEAALAADRVVVSLDDSARDAFRIAAAAIADLQPIVWVNPVSDAESPLAWLAAGARPEAKRLLRPARRGRR